MASRLRRLFGPLLMRRLFLQIYLTIIASLVLVVFLSGVLWEIYGRERVNDDFLDSIAKLVALSIPDKAASQEAQQQAIARLGQELDLEINLFDENRQLLAAYGNPTLPRERLRGRTGWSRVRGGPVLSLALPDGRWLVADANRAPNSAPVLSLLFILALIAVVVGLGVFPIARRLTKRLEHLQRGVERIGSGDLKTRVKVEGRDEVAQLAGSFNAAADKIENLVAAHRLLLANASHELRTPLARIKLGLEMEQIQPSRERSVALKQDIAELNKLIDEILVMSRLDAAMPMESVEPIDLVALLAEECAQFDGCAFSGSAPEVCGDPRLLHRMLANLLENALKHGRPPVKLTLSATQETATLDIQDAGSGIPASEQENVFLPFYRGPDRQNIEGYGLGLALVRKIAEAHGGKALIFTGPNGNSITRVVLPLPGSGT
ncbi:MAG: HAMP domain-containing protein [Roseibium sp.]|uniref:sensor histidine kinase n=1 Tax=Roseibium sp. TaxID=1936156 RepID=UPI00260E8285|nr:ATP-binding protein [Roseibium sp.]MCV0427834.1 HAMP domain-containing protein [Roseibium sp.]